ncbi:hypothetical protein GLOIN_2v1790329 [Rhizophagus irregularis DAOM 181602=DAOM 197198]|nr:hypothetical protein GLOIN_2v1790329 [Rhizophagus irregularis DAOM 181602=DAOM 197198]
MYSLSFEIITQIIDEVFYLLQFEHDYLELRVVNRIFNSIILKIIFSNPFKYFKYKRLLVSLYIYYIDDLDNLFFLNTHIVDLQLITKSFLSTKKINYDKFKKFAENTISFKNLLKEFDYYEFICSFFDGLNLLILNFYLETKIKENVRLYWISKSIIPFKSYEKTILNVKRVNIKVNFVDYEAMSMLSKLEQIEKLELEFLDYNSHNSQLETFVIYIRNLIKNYRNLKVLIFKNWKWNRYLLTNFGLWSIFNPNIVTLKNCTIETWVIAKVTEKFYHKLKWNSRKKNYST